jgi:hypothetical protein
MLGLRVGQAQSRVAASGFGARVSAYSEPKCAQTPFACIHAARKSCDTAGILAWPRVF